ncbi:Protein of unknown function (DUF1232) [Parelusimicrobium proximum]|uniref:YkvA family protein n=1 Tax=Parelusimicrobium proximum TaxID=3228953 RepID=UPI003D16597D
MSKQDKQPKDKDGFFQDIEDYFAMTKAVLKKQYKTPYAAYLWPLAALVYFVSPIDIIPDFVLPILGWGDDAAVMLFTLARVRAETRKFRASQDKKQLPQKTED